MVIEEELLGERYRLKGDGGPVMLTQAQKNARALFLKEIHYKNGYHKIEACPSCGQGSKFIKISQVDRRGLPADIVVCDKCGFCFKMNILKPSSSRFHYENVSYVLRGKGAALDCADTDFLSRLKSFAYPRYSFISHFLRLEPGRDLIAELGCNDGANLLPWKEAGFEVLGIDLDPKIVEFGRKKGLDLISGDFMDYDFSLRKPRLLILSHILEHVTDINMTLERLRKIIDPDGYLFIESPGIRVHGLNNTLAYFDTEHNYNFDMKAVKSIFERHLFKVLYADEYIRAICTPGGNGASSASNDISFSLNKIAAGVISKFVKFLRRLNDLDLRHLLKKGESKSIDTVLLSKLQTLYFRLYYAAITDERRERKGADR
jgi:hypothetical protein